MAAFQDLKGWLLRGSFVTLLGRIAFGTFAILQSAVLARLLDSADLGAYLLTQTVIVPFMLFALWGNDLLAIKWMGAERNLFVVLLSGSSVVLAISLLTGGAVALGVMGLAAVSPTWALLASWSWWLLPLIVLSAAQMYCAAVFRGLREIGKATLLNGVLSSLLLLIVSTGAYLGGVPLSTPHIIILQTAMLAVSVAWGVLDLAVALRQPPAGFEWPGREVWREICISGGPLMLTQVLAFIVTQSDVWIVSSYAPASDVAGYALAARLAQLVSLPHLVLNGMLPPLMASWYSGHQVDRLNRVVGMAVQAALGMALGLAVFYAVAGQPILQILFHGYGAWFDVLLMLTLGNIANVAAGPCSQMLIMAGQGKILLWITAVNCIVCCGLGLLIGVWHGPRATAAMYAGGLAMQGIVSAHWTQKRTQVRTYPSLSWPSWRDLGI